MVDDVPDQRGSAREARSAWTVGVPSRTVAIAVAGTLVVAAAAWAIMSFLGGGPLDASGPGECMTRTARLAGFDGVTVADSDDGVVVRIVLPGPDSPADIEIAWQTACAAASSAFPRADLYRIELVSGSEVVAALVGQGADVRAAVSADDGELLRDALGVEYVLEDASAAPLPAESITAESATPEDAAFLDAKNRAAGLLGEEGPTPAEATRLAEECATMRAAVDGRPAVEPSEAFGEYAGRIVHAIDRSAEGADRVLDEIQRLADSGAEQATASITRLRAISLVTEAVSAERSYGSLLADTYAVADLVGTNPLTKGALSDAVLVAAHDDAAPAEARLLEEFERAEELDLLPDGATSNPVGEVVREMSSGVPVTLADGVATVKPQVWHAYRRADDTVFWRGEDASEFALTDGSVRGWAYSRGAAAVVDPGDVGTVYSLFLSGSVPE